MHIYFAGIGGVAIGPLAEIAQEAGYEVSGSDLASSMMTEQLKQRGIDVTIGQTGAEIAAVHLAHPINWVVITSALPPNHPEIAFAKVHGIRLSKRDALLNHIIADKKLKLLAMTGTHGKTTTTAMMVWLFKQFDVPAAYSVGTTLTFGPSGHFDAHANYFIYEADEYDRNMLHFHPAICLIASLDYDHPDTYPTVDNYKQAFRDFIDQSQKVYMWHKDLEYVGLQPQPKIEIVRQSYQAITLHGEHNRQNATLVATSFAQLFPEFTLVDIMAALNHFPGTARRFEKLADNLYTDYAHHPAEIAAMVRSAAELSEHVVVVYQPHQNRRQHEVIHDYKNSFVGAEHVYWLPTYLSREDPNQAVLTPSQLISHLHDPTIAEPAELDDQLIQHIRTAHAQGKLVLVMGAGNVDTWLRQHVAAILG